MAEDMTQKVLRIMKTPNQIRNIGIAAHIDHGKTTLSDNLLAGAGMISEELAGKQLVMDFLEEEQQRGITIQTANISMVHEIEDKEFLINLLDTPGHVDFGGDVTRAMRAVDGAVVVACAVEGCMPQTETVLRQALKERVKPVLFINKVDRLIKEIKLTPEAMQERFVKLINEVNRIIRTVAPPEYKEAWQVSVQGGTVAFGSAYNNWALSLPIMQKKNVSFKDILEEYQKNEEEAPKVLYKKAPLHEAVLDMVVKHLPAPNEAQKYRIPKLWSGEIDSPIGQDLVHCDSNGKVVFVVTKIVVDPQAGEVSYGRVFSGTLEKGKEIILNRAQVNQRVQQVVLSKGAQRLVVDSVPAGNVAGIVGLKNSASGETVSEEKMEPFEAITHIFDPVVSKAIEAKNPKDLPKLIEALKQLEKEDPTIKIEINEETGENIISGLGELHLEIKENILKRDMGLQIVSSEPIVVYRETIEKQSDTKMGKSPNKHNHLFVKVEPMDEKIYEAIHSGEIPEQKIKKRKPDVEAVYVKHGMVKDDARRVKEIYKGNILIDDTRGIVHIGEIIELIMAAFEEAARAGPLAREPFGKLVVRLMDAKLHEDSIHRGPAQIIPSMRGAIFNAMLSTGDVLLEPIQTIRIDGSVENLGAISKLIQSRRGQLLDTNQEGESLVVKAKLPVAESFGFTSSLRSATAGKAAWFLVDQSYERLPHDLQKEVALKIRRRKGLKEEIPAPEEE